MKGWLIFFAVCAIIIFGLYELVDWYDNLPDIKANSAKLDEEWKWEANAESLAHKTNDTSVLKSIYMEAIHRGADPSWVNKWDCCDDITYVYKYAHAKYEVLMEK